MLKKTMTETEVLNCYGSPIDFVCYFFRGCRNIIMTMCNYQAIVIV